MAGETAFNVVSLFVGASEVQTAFKVARGGQATSLLSKGTSFVKTLGKAGVGNAKSLLTMPARISDNLTALGNRAMNGLDDLFGKSPRLAFAGVGDSESILSRITRNADEIKPNNIQKNFNQMMGEGSEVVLKKTPKNYQIPDEAQKILSEHKLSVEDFNRINAKQVKTAEEIALLKEMREKIPMPTSTTDMRKVIPIEFVDSTITNPKFSNVGGFVTDQTYVKDITNINDVIDSSRLDYPGSKYKPDGDYAYIDFITEDITNLEVPYSPKFGGTYTDDWPFTGSGFTAEENGTLIPEWKAPKGKDMVPKEGSVIHQVIDGNDEIIARWVKNPITEIEGWEDLR